jgi:hypothetical protein
VAGHVGGRELTSVRAEVLAIVDALLEASEPTKEITLDAIGDAIGAKAITPDEIDALITALEAAGRVIVGPKGGDGEDHLRAVLGAARALTPELGRRPTTAEIAERSGLTLLEVRHALALAKVMQR